MGAVLDVLAVLCWGVAAIGAVAIVLALVWLAADWWEL